MAFLTISRHSGGEKREKWARRRQSGFSGEEIHRHGGHDGRGQDRGRQALARRLGVDFLDSDEEIVKAANMSIAEIFARDGEDFFRDRESEVIGRLLETERAVLSTGGGGGAFLAERNRDMITDRGGVSVWLRADLELLWNRVKHKDTRPLLRTPDPKATLTEIYNTRVPVYALADLAVDARPEYSIDDMCAAVVAALKTRPDVLEEG